VMVNSLAESIEITALPIAESSLMFCLNVQLLISEGNVSTNCKTDASSSTEFYMN